MCWGTEHLFLDQIYHGHDGKERFGIHFLGVSDLLPRPLVLVQKGTAPIS